MIPLNFNELSELEGGRILPDWVHELDGYAANYLEQWIAIPIGIVNGFSEHQGLTPGCN